MNTIEQIIAHADQSCRDRGSRLTTKRKQVLRGLLQTKKAMSAYELADYCQAELGESLPAMSVYRILTFLQKEHLAHKLNLVNKYVVCAHITCAHNHDMPQFLICQKCQKVQEITIPQSVLITLRSAVANQGFMLSSNQLEMNGICKSCAA